MSTAALVVVCALDLLGRSAAQFPPIVLLDATPPGVSPNAEGFARKNPDTIYLLTGTSAFRTAVAAEATLGHCWARKALTKIASVIVHEEWHLNHGTDERGAYFAQLTALTLLGEGPGTPIFHWVQRSMQSVLDQPRAPVEATRLARR